MLEVRNSVVEENGDVVHLPAHECQQKRIQSLPGFDLGICTAVQERRHESPIHAPFGGNLDGCQLETRLGKVALFGDVDLGQCGDFSHNLLMTPKREGLRSILRTGMKTSCPRMWLVSRNHDTDYGEYVCFCRLGALGNEKMCELVKPLFGHGIKVGQAVVELLLSVSPSSSITEPIGGGSSLLAAAIHLKQWILAQALFLARAPFISSNDLSDSDLIATELARAEAFQFKWPETTNTARQRSKRQKIKR